MNIEIFDLAEQIKEAQKKINELNEMDYEKIHMYSDQIFNLKLKLQKLEAKAYLERKPDIESDDIDLYIKNIHDTMEEQPDKFSYIITKHNSKEVVGTIDIRFHLLKQEYYLGNVGTNIKEEYRGNRYSKKAFILLKDTMLNYGLTKPIFTVKETNASSLKSLENIGAKQIDYISDTDEPYYAYEYDLVDNNNRVK